MTQTIGHLQKNPVCFGETRFAHPAKAREEMFLCVVVSTHHQKMTMETYLCLVTSWGLSHVGGRANKKQMLLGGIMLFIKPISSLTQLSQL